MLAVAITAEKILGTVHTAANGYAIPGTRLDSGHYWCHDKGNRQRWIQNDRQPKQQRLIDVEDPRNKTETTKLF